ncbi:MAG: response regulator [Wenzhouxiangella sp.]
MASSVTPDYEAIGDELLDTFIEESLDLLEHADGLLQQWQDSPEDKTLVTGLQRDLHTLKGSARMVGLDPFASVAHALEELLEGIAAGTRRATADRRNALEAGCDHLNALLEAILDRKALPTKTIEELLDAQVAELSPEQLLAEPVVTETGGKREEASSQRPDQLRVDADLVDELVNQAGEISIFRSRLEQTISQLRANIIEVEETVSRLRGQLRKLEIETEAQVLARFEREHGPSEEDFDPLELDRYSTIQQLSRALAESTGDLGSLTTLLEDNARQSENLLLQQSRVANELQEGLMQARMVSFNTLLPRFRRVVRNACRELGKQAELDVQLEGEGLLDRNVLDRMTAPIEHLLRNSVSHGVEQPARRREAGKPETGHIRIEVVRESTELVIRVSDDGAGLNLQRVRDQARASGLVDPDQTLDDAAAAHLVFAPGLTTADKVSELSGRGIGLDVVANTVRQTGGSVTVETQTGAGTTFTIRIPLSLTVLQGILVGMGGRQFAIPLQAVRGVVRLPVADWQARLHDARPELEYGGQRYRLLELEPQLDFAPEPPRGNTLNLLMVETGDQRAALKVGDLQGHREIVIKPVGPQISSVVGILGATISGDGQVVPILDIGPLLRRAFATGRIPTAEPAAAVATSEPTDHGAHLVLVVDDSITVRRVTERVLQQQGFEVITARDGLDAVEVMVDRKPDLILLDIEMPRMDGYELAVHVRNDRRLMDIPMIMITSRSGEKHRNKATALGINDYMTKPYQENDLLARVAAQLGLDEELP